MFTCNVFCILTLKLAGMNGYYLQFMLPLTFFERWFTHERNPLIEGRHITEAEAREYKKQMVAAIKKRGLEFHACGHGWTCTPYDLPAGGWEVFEGEIDEETKNDFALVGGKRELWQGIPLNTELCYSKAYVRKKVADFCVSYIKENPEIDIIHFTLSDGLYNHCECDECRKYLPSVLMVMILNDVDKYSRVLSRGGYMLLSGFYFDEVAMVAEAAAKYGMKFDSSKEDNKWALLKLIKV